MGSGYDRITDSLREFDLEAEVGELDENTELKVFDYIDAVSKSLGEKLPPGYRGGKKAKSLSAGGRKLQAIIESLRGYVIQSSVRHILFRKPKKGEYPAIQIGWTRLIETVDPITKQRVYVQVITPEGLKVHEGYLRATQNSNKTTTSLKSYS